MNNYESKIKKIYKDGKISKKMYEILLEIKSNIENKNKCKDIK